MEVRTATLTPDQAAEILARSKSVHQRPISTARVNMLVSAIKGGQFRPTHQPVALSPKGYLIDGQHRLTAIVAAGQPVDITVAYDVDPDTFDVIDTGRARTPGNTLQIAGIPDANVVAAAVRLVLIHDRIKGTRMVPNGAMRAEWTTHTILETAEDARGTMLRKHIPEAVRIGAGLGRSGIRTWLSAALTLIEESGADAGLRAEFTDKLESGALLPAMSPILALRKWIAGDTGYSRIGRSSSSLVALGAVIKTWNDWLQGRDRAAILFRLGDEVMPIPQSGYVDTADTAPDEVLVDNSAESVPT